jgi:DNA-binding MarR family transcriptional regulator
MLTREADPADGRSAVFNLTPEGRKLASIIMSKAQVGQNRFLNLLKPDECWVLLDAIDVLLAFAKTNQPKTQGPEDD